MDNYKRLSQLRDEDYQELFGVTKTTFDKMLEILEKAYAEQSTKGGRPLSALSILDKLVIMLQYYREYRTMQHIAFDYGVSKTAIWKSIRWVEGILIKSKEFALPSKRKLLEDTSVQAVLVDVTECEIERPQKKQKVYYSGKKKKHTLKVQIVADASTLDVLCIFVGKGSQHDFRIFQNSKVHILSRIWAYTDKAYQGLTKLHGSSLIPIKATKNHKLSPEEKKYNSIISKLRIYIEHINRYIKRFRILSSRYRNRRKRFGLRVSLICGIYNFQHASKVR